MSRPGTRRKMLEVAAKEVGYKEGPNNATKYGIHSGMNNQPWCALFLKWVGDTAGVALPGWSAYVPSWVDHYAKADQLRKRGVRGDIVFFDFAPGTGPAEHVGIVTSGWLRNGLGLVTTIEGNTWSGHGVYQGEGDGVYRRTRFRPDILGYGRPHYGAHK